MTDDPVRPVFFLSDGTGITAETLGSTLLTQFKSGWAEYATLPFVDTPEKAHAARERVEAAGRDAGASAIVFSTTVRSSAREVVRHGDYLFIDLFDAFETRLEGAFQTEATHLAGRAHGKGDTALYSTRIEAMNYALGHDDGLAIEGYDRAQVIVIAPSRCGKTPVSLYMAMQFGIFAANYPLTEDDETDRFGLPKALAPYQSKLHGLWVKPEQLHQIRSERRRGSRYASMEQVGAELGAAVRLCERFDLPYADSSHKSIEELATLIMQSKNLRHPGF